MAKKKKAEKHVHSVSKSAKPKTGFIPTWHIPLILIITFLVYLPSLTAGFVNWDDPDYVGENNFLIRDLSRLPELVVAPVQGNHHPITMISIAINYAISGDDAWSYHLFNIIFHLINCFLVYKLALLLTRNNILVAFVTSLLFAIHPLHVESVAWVSERKDVLYALFFIAGHISFIKYLDTNSKKQYWLTLLFVVLSLLSKPAAVIFPVSLFCIDVLRQRKFSFQLITEKIPFFIPAIIMGIITINAQQKVGATGEEYFGLAKNILFGFYGILMYFVKMIIPYKQSAFYPFPALNEELPVVYYIAPVFALLLAAVSFITWKKYRFVAFGIGFYIVNLLLVLQIFSVGSAVIAERYTYVPYIGLFFIAGCLLDRLAKKEMKKAYIIIAPVALIFCVISFFQVQKWHSGATLWDSVIKNQPSSRAYSARATLLRKDANALKDSSGREMSRGRTLEANRLNEEANKNYNKAIEYYTQAIKLNAIDHESYNNRANIYMDLGKFDNALPDYKQALVVKPNYYVANDNLGALYARKNRYDSALYYFNLALKEKPDYKVTYQNRGLSYMALKQYELAIKDWQTVLQYEPDAADVINTIGLCYRMLGKPQDALTYINRAIQRLPNPEFYMNRSYAYRELYNITRDQKNFDNAKNDALVAQRNGVPVEASHKAYLGIQ